MKNTGEVSWVLINKEDLVDMLLGDTNVSSYSKKRSFPGRDLKNGKIAVGSTALSRNGKYEISYIVIPDSYINDFLSWVRVYSDDIFPISQFTRLLTLSEYSLLSNESLVFFDATEKLARWACVSIGETLAQSESSIELHNIALSRVLSTYTLPIARSSINHSGLDLFKLCRDRLNKISHDNRFSRRTLLSEHLSPVWDVVLNDDSDDKSALDAVNLMLDYASKYTPENRKSDDTLLELLAKNLLLRSDSVEDRVMGFNKLSAEIMNLESDSELNFYSPVIAAAAFLVGRSTSHLFLLNKIGRFVPMAFVWFGLIASFTGPKSWDLTWLRAVKGAEKLLKNKFELDSISQADIYWHEFSWLLEVFKSTEKLNELPKMLPKTLSIEIIPGSTLHLRLPGQANEQEAKMKNEISMRERALEDALSQLFSLSNKLQGQVNYYSSQKERSDAFSKKNSGVSVTRNKGSRKV
ncbi:hypothetical protein [Pantoea sp. Fr+CA_20]|uniref:hypothetical protein n=1 Tax=Pantoea sp. Fr+CA_20 TaxID=2929506 RepID=UPI002117F941|nr:hypothetical protein [Pantoea sp. Fr+CA_20]